MAGNSLYTDTDSMSATGNSTKANAEEYLAEIGKIYNYIDDLASRWKGADNQAYAAKTNSYRADMDKLGHVINDFGDFIISAANSYKSTQDSILSGINKL